MKTPTGIMFRAGRRCVLVLFLCVLFFSTVACETSGTRSSAANNGTPVAVSKILGAFNAIEGTHYQIATVSTDFNGSSGRNDLGSLFSSGRSDYSVYNYVFLDIDAETVHALLPTNDNTILSIQGYPTPGPVDPVSGEKVPVAVWLYMVVKEDTNHDGSLSSKDKQTLAISDVGGNGYTEIISDVDQVFGNVLKNATTLLVVYSSSDKTYLAHIDLPGHVVTKTTELPDFGGNIK